MNSVPRAAMATDRPQTARKNAKGHGDREKMDLVGVVEFVVLLLYVLRARCIFTKNVKQIRDNGAGLAQDPAATSGHAGGSQIDYGAVESIEWPNRA